MTLAAIAGQTVVELYRLRGLCGSVEKLRRDRKLPADSDCWPNHFVEWRGAS